MSNLSFDFSSKFGGDHLTTLKKPPITKHTTHGQDTHDIKLSVKHRLSRIKKANAQSRKERVDSLHSSKVYDRELSKYRDIGIKREISKLNRQIAKLSRYPNNDADILELTELRDSYALQLTV